MVDNESVRERGSASEDARHAAALSPWLWAAGAGVLTAVAVFVALPERSAPPALIGLLAGRDVRGVDVHGGVKITYRARGADSGAGHGDALAQAARIIEQRVAEVGSADVAVTDREITVEVAGVTPEAGPDVARTLSSRGELSFHKIVSGSDLAKTLYRRAVDGADPSIEAGEDAWSHDETATTMDDYYLRAADRGALERFLARAAAEDPALAPEPGRTFLFEHVRPESISNDDARAPFWRTYYAEARADLDQNNIADSYVYWEPTTNRAAVLVIFDDAGAARLEEITRSQVGDKIAIVLDGVVDSAPVVQDAITGGRSTITMGGSSSAQVEAEAYALAAVLKNRVASPLPVALEAAAITPIAATVTDAQHVGATLLLALLAGLAAFVLVRVVEHRAQPLDVALAGPAGARPWGRLAVTLGALGVVYAGTTFVFLPGMEELAMWLAMEGGQLDGQLSVFALGITPFLSAFLVVEIVALLVPRWRPLRIGGPLGRARLTRATILLTVLFTLAQSWGFATWLTEMAAGNPFLAFQPGYASSALVALTVTGGVMMLWILAGLVSRHGLGNGVSVILLAGVAGVPTALRSMGQAASPGAGAGGDVALFAIAACAIIAITSRVLRSRAGGALGLRLPTCGIVPLIQAETILSLPATILAATGVTGAAAWMEIADGIAIRLAQAAVLAVVFSLLFSRPRLVAGQVQAVVAGAAARRVDAFWLATAASAGYVVGLAGLAWLMLHWAPSFAHDVVSIAVFTAIAMDLLTEWRARRRCRDLVAVWPVHRVQVADVAVRALQDAGIGAHTRGRYHRSLLYFFGPFVPIDIMVPADRAREAAERLRDVLGGDLPAPRESNAGEPRQSSAPETPPAS